MNKPQIKTDALAAHLRTDEVVNSDADYLAWKEAKVRRALEQSKSREQMIPVRDIWDAFDLEH